MLDSDLAMLYEVETFNLNKAVKRNIDRFPEDFMFQLTKEEAGALRFQIGISKTEGRGGRRYLPYVFTEQGVAMLSTVLNSERAVKGPRAALVFEKSPLKHLSFGFSFRMRCSGRIKPKTCLPD